MQVYTVSFFGHRTIENGFEVRQHLEKEVTRLIEQMEYVEFLVGRDGDFDIIAASVIRRIKTQRDLGNCSLTLVLPYMKAEFRNNEQLFLNYYDEVEICEQSSRAHYKSAIPIRNRAMVDRSDLIICYIKQSYGGAYKTICYAEKHGRKIINMNESRIF